MVPELKDGTQVSYKATLGPEAIATLYKLLRFKTMRFRCNLNSRWYETTAEGPEIMKFLTFLKDEAPDTCKDATNLSGTFSSSNCDTIKWSADNVTRENRLTDRLLSRLDNGAAYSLFDQNFACFDNPTNDARRVHIFIVAVI